MLPSTPVCEYYESEPVGPLTQLERVARDDQ